MKLVISFCNQQKLDTKSNLIILDTKTGSKILIEFSTPELGYTGMTGLTQDKNFIYALFQSAIPVLAIIDKRNYVVLQEIQIPEAKDVHSLIIVSNTLYIVSTGTDSVLKYEIDRNTFQLKYIGVVWKPDGSEGITDTHHLNAIYESNGQIYVSGFGQKKVSSGEPQMKDMFGI